MTGKNRIRRRVYDSRRRRAVVLIPETVSRHFHMPHGLLVPDIAVSALPWPFTKIQEAGQQ